MKTLEELPVCDIELASETLAVAFSECGRKKSLEDDRRGSLASNHRGGKSLFRRFVKENSTSVWKPELVKSVSTVRFGGYLQDPPTLLLQGNSTNLQHIRDAWSNRLLRPPVGYHIDFVGDVTRIGARPLSRGRFISLSDAVCVSIENVTSRDDVATQESILVEVEGFFPDVHSPSRELLHTTLGKLIRDRKVFCTGPGYLLVTKKTYSGKQSETDQEHWKNRNSHKQECDACAQNRAAFESKVIERRSYRVKKNRENSTNYDIAVQEKASPPLPNSTPLDSLHGSVVQNVMAEQSSITQEKRSSPKKSLDREGQSRKSSGSLVGKMAGKIFGKRRKSSSDRRIPHDSDTTSPKHRDDSTQVRDLNEHDARRLGYEVSNLVQKSSQRTNSRETRSNSESPVKRTNSTGRRSRVTDNPETSEQAGLRVSRSFRCEKKHGSLEKNHEIPDVIPEKHRTKEDNPQKSDDQRKPVKFHNPGSSPDKSPKPERHRSIPGSNQFPKHRDVAVSCNLEDDNMTSEIDGHLRSPQRETSLKSPRRSKSLRLPRERRTHEYESTPKQVFTPEPNRKMDIPQPEYNSLRKSDTSHGMTYDSLQRSIDDRIIRRSVSSTSTGRDYSYLHACNIAPSVRIGSVIADHLDELGRRRRFWEQRSIHEMSPPPSMASSNLSRRSNETSSVEATPRDRVVVSPNPQEDRKENENNTESEVQNGETMDPETEAALKVAKRLVKLNIKMTRQEWKEYFANKILPEQVEKALLEAKMREKENDSSTCFENTSGSVETVIDVHQRDKSKSRLSRNSTNSSGSSSPSSDPSVNWHRHPRVHRKSLRKSNGDEHGSSRTADSSPMANDSNNNWGREEPRKLWAGQTDFPVLHKCPDVNLHEDFDGHFFYTCDLGHRHLPYCDQHKQLAAMDNASLTEDSGFHSARERSSLASRDTRKKPRGTFV